MYMKGKIIVIEGSTDGVGKTSQVELLVKHLKEDGYQVVTHHFPTVDSPGSSVVEEYLKGKLGSKEQLSPYAINSFYAIDRLYTYITELKEAYEAGKIIVLDRYTTSSMVYQSASLSIDKRDDFIEWVKNYEYQLLGLPKPDMVLYLSVEEATAAVLRKERTTSDLHEKDQIFLERVYQNSQWIAKREHWEIINCLDENNSLLSKETIHHLLYEIVMNKLRET